MIHKHFRKLCNTLVDVDEWGQIIILKMLARYARSNFLNPADAEDAMGGSDDATFYGAKKDDEEDDDECVLPLFSSPPLRHPNLRVCSDSRWKPQFGGLTQFSADPDAHPSTGMMTTMTVNRAKTMMRMAKERRRRRSIRRT